MFLKIKDVNVYYEEVGSGTPVVMIHGYSPDHRIMSFCMEPVFQKTAKEYRRIYFDLPGMGRTASNSVKNADDMLGIVLGFIEKTVGEEKFIIAGESYGGYLARGVAMKMRKQVLGISFICPLIVPEEKNRNLPEKIILEKDEALLASLSENELNSFYLSGSAVYSKKVWEGYKESIYPAVQIADRDFLEDYFKNGYSFSFDVDRCGAPYEFPILFLAGRQDYVVGYKDIWKILDNYPRASYVVLDKCGHNLQIEQDIIFEESTKEWLARIDDFRNT